MRTVGLRIKSGFAIAIVAVQESESWRIERRAEVQLALDEGPYGRFPYHPLIELKGAKAAATSRRAVAAVRAVARKQMSAFLKSIGAVDGATLIVGSLIDPSTIGNPHIRTHAREGELFRGVVARALERKGIRLQILRERDLYTHGAKRLVCTDRQFRQQVDRLGRGIVKPWSADEKLAAAGAFIAA